MKLSSQFENDWSQQKRDPPIQVQPSDPRFTINYRALSGDEVERLNKQETIYFFQRVEYSDSTGTWVADKCEHFQVTSALFVRVLHPRLVFSNPRRKVKQ